MNFIIAGIHTEIGKTVTSAVLAQALGYDYWKPVQAGDLDNSDSIFVKNNVSDPKCQVHEEAFRLSIPASPHWAAQEDGVEISPDKIMLPETSNHLIVETAGGLMSPLAKGFLNIDMIKHLALPVILVSNNYLGSINHTLLSADALKKAQIPVLGLVFCGEEVPSSREFILEHTRLPLLLSIPKFEKVDKNIIGDFAATIAAHLKKELHEFR